MAANRLAPGPYPASVPDNYGRTGQFRASWAEHDWLDRFRTLTEVRTGLMITHRFTSPIYAEIIHASTKDGVWGRDP